MGVWIEQAATWAAHAWWASLIVAVPFVLAGMVGVGMESADTMGWGCLLMMLPPVAIVLPASWAWGIHFFLLAAVGLPAVLHGGTRWAQAWLTRRWRAPGGRRGARGGWIYGWALVLAVVAPLAAWLLPGVSVVTTAAAHWPEALAAAAVALLAWRFVIPPQPSEDTATPP